MKLQYLWKYTVVTGVVFGLCINSMANQVEPDSLKPVVRKAVVPKVGEQDLTQAAPEQLVEQWQPGDPVRVVDDLKSSDEAEMSQAKDQPVVRPPVKAETMNSKLDELPTAELNFADDEVRVVEDLKEDSTDDPDADKEPQEDPPD